MGLAPVEISVAKPTCKYQVKHHPGVLLNLVIRNMSDNVLSPG